MLEDRKPRYWFPTKRYGWGWGLPATWQGWVVLIAYIATVTAASFLIAAHSLIAMYASIVLISLVFLAVVWRTGEPPRWRWGD